MRAMEADCWRVELFTKAVELGGSIALKRVEPGFPFRDYHDHPKGTAMKLITIAFAAALPLCGS